MVENNPTDFWKGYHQALDDVLKRKTVFISYWYTIQKVKKRAKRKEYYERTGK